MDSREEFVCSVLKVCVDFLKSLLRQALFDLREQ